MPTASGEVVCRTLRYDEIQRAVDVVDRAFQDNLFAEYLFNPPDAKDPRRIDDARRAANFLQIAYYASRKEALTIDGGGGIVTYAPAFNALSPWRRTLARMWRTLVFIFLVFVLRWKGTKEQRLRLREALAKSSAARLRMGGDLDDMFYVDTLAVAPDKQGLRYGSVLLEAIVTKADVQSRRTYLSTRPETTSFYERFGFRVMAGYTLGEDNPTWTEPPVQRVVMVREPRLPKNLGRA